MAKPELGTKRTCPVTGRKFYDLNKDPIVSPFTGESYPRSYFEPAARTVARADAESTDDGDNEETAAEVISLEEADAESAASSKVSVSDDVDVDDDLDTGDDDTFLEEDEDDNDDVSDLIGDGLEDDEEG
ncbi:TIGR02300 family protein [Xanthobacter sp. TB0136]|uniref:TIGR02300 family protein n=1 Tax=Xanthobacter sp. TB0136 TaxID=3459177 RepID=UPI0040396C27